MAEPTLADVLIEAGQHLKHAADALVQAGLLMREQETSFPAPPTPWPTAADAGIPGAGIIPAPVPKEKRPMAEWTDQELMDENIQANPMPNVPLPPARPGKDYLAMVIGEKRGIPLVDHRITVGDLLALADWILKPTMGMDNKREDYRAELAMCLAKIHEKGHLANEATLKASWRWALSKEHPERKVRLTPYLRVLETVLRERKILHNPAA